MRSHIRLQTSRTKTTGSRSSRLGFTLIELLMVIVIIAILMALAMGAYQSIMGQVTVASVKVEIDQMGNALADFKAKFGEYPPSSITLLENPTAANNWSPAARKTLRKYWQNFNFGLQQDINGDGDQTDTIVLNGAECLVFFLGGINDNGDTSGPPRGFGNGGVPNGFSTNPATPFSRAGTTRVGPFMEFDPGRLSDGDNDGFPGFRSKITSQTNPYVYASSYNGRGYNKADVSMFIADVYRQKSSTGPFWNPKSFQIISPGSDDKYGNGGKFDVDSADVDLAAGREVERDNITNFHSGLLAP